MLIFCPTCGNILTLKGSGLQEKRFFCMTCPYQMVIDADMAIAHVNTEKKEVAALISDNSNAGKAKANAKCPKCEHPEAWFHQMQTRSADEASTIFYECCNTECKHKWKENG